MTLPNPNVNWTNGTGGVDPYKPKDEPRLYYLVQGRGTFPLDMLRYDQSWAITDLGDPNDFSQGLRAVVCCTGSKSSRIPTVARWDSFGWAVTTVSKDVQAAILNGLIRPEAILLGKPSDRPFTGRCQRCGSDATSATMSRFNSDMICPDCEQEEKEHDDYDLACQIELDSVRIGNMNYPGIGWPRPQDATNKADIFRK